MFHFSGNEFYVKKNFLPPDVEFDDHSFCAVMVCCPDSSTVVTNVLDISSYLH